MAEPVDRTAELVLNANSEARQTLKVIANRWVSIVLCALGDGSKRYSELDGMIEGLSQRMLTRTLKELERNSDQLRFLIYREAASEVFEQRPVLE